MKRERESELKNVVNIFLELRTSLLCIYVFVSGPRIFQKFKSKSWELWLLQHGNKRTTDHIKCKTRNYVYKISCSGVINKGEQCMEIKTSRSVAERFKDVLQRRGRNRSCTIVFSVNKGKVLDKDWKSKDLGDMRKLSMSETGLWKRGFPRVANSAFPLHFRAFMCFFPIFDL